MVQWGRDRARRGLCTMSACQVRGKGKDAEAWLVGGRVTMSAWRGVEGVSVAPRTLSAFKRPFDSMG